MSSKDKNLLNHIFIVLSSKLGGHFPKNVTCYQNCDCCSVIPAHHVVPACRLPGGLPGVLLELRALRALLRHVERLPLLARRLLADLPVLGTRRTTLSLYSSIDNFVLWNFGIGSNRDRRVSLN